MVKVHRMQKFRKTVKVSFRLSEVPEGPPVLTISRLVADWTEPVPRVVVMSTQPTLKDLKELGITVHSSVIVNPANGFVKEEDSKENALEGGAPLLSAPT
mgnify:CR=1 FL=1